MRHVVLRRFGLDGQPPQTLEEVGHELGITRERVRQLETRALRELRAVAPRLGFYLRTTSRVARRPPSRGALARRLSASTSI